MSTSVTPTKKEYYSPIQDSFLSALPKEEKERFDVEVNFAIQAMIKNPFLQKMDRQSVLLAVLNVAQCGLTLNPVLNQAYLVPHKGKCVLYPSYQGMAHLLLSNGGIKSYECHLVYEGDEIVFDLASEKKVVKHVPYFFNNKEQGECIGGYSVAVLPDGTILSEVMSLKDIQDIQLTSENYKAYKAGKTKSSVWVDHFDEMARKTIFRRHFKRLPLTSIETKLQKVIELDNQDYNYEASMSTLNYIESLMMEVELNKVEYQELNHALASGLRQKEALEIIKRLESKKPDPILSGQNYQQDQIQQHLKDL